METYYRGTKENPFHLSVGAVLVNDKNEICCHYFKNFEYKPNLVKLEDFYILMRETVETGESLEDAVARGLLEEFGAKGEIIKYIGSIKSQFYRADAPIEKTTLYFLVKLKEINLAKRKKDDEEKASVIQWQSIDFLIIKMKKQLQLHKRTDLDESVILERVKK